MTYNKTITLKDGSSCLLRNGTKQDGYSVFEVFMRSHSETDNLLSYPEENSMNPEEEGEFLEESTNSNNAIEILAFIDNKVVGTAGIQPIGHKYKVKHRADFGISVLKEFWGLGIGTALLDASLECAKHAGYKQVELDVVSENSKAITIYKKAGFVEFGRNPLGFNSKISGYQELVLMRKELN